MVMTYIYHQMLLHTRNKNMYGLGVGISTVFEKCGHFLFKGGGSGPPRMFMTYTPFYVPSHKEKIYTV
jgi:hypothetical protein